MQVLMTFLMKRLTTLLMTLRTTLLTTSVADDVGNNSIHCVPFSEARISSLVITLRTW